MSPILGIYASSKPPAAPNSYESIATSTVGVGGAASVTFSSIPSTYQHLQIRYISKSTSAFTSDAFSTVRFNGDSGSNYAMHALLGDGGSATSFAATSQTNAWIGLSPYGPSVTAFSGAVVDILDYANVNKNKTLRSLCGYDKNGGGAITLNSGLWINTSAISSMVITATSFPFAEYSSFALYGIKG